MTKKTGKHITNELNNYHKKKNDKNIDNIHSFNNTGKDNENKILNKVNTIILSNKLLNSKWILLFPVILFTYVFIINAWITDDAYITFRTIDNFINGYGLTWNTIERVQAYTHPLWMFFLSIFYFITREIYITTIVVSLILCLLTIYLITYKINNNKINGIFAIMLLFFSKPFIDYSSSGLENPMTYFLITFFIYIYYTNNDNKRILLLSLIASFATINRMDTILFFIPSLIYEVYKNKYYKNKLKIIIGFTPFILWELFSILYYGFPFPNTAYAKLNTGISNSELLIQGINYLINSFVLNPITLLIILATILYTIIRAIKSKKINSELLFTIGITLYLVYIIKIGGDFMSGRFIAAPFLISVILLVKTKFILKNNNIVLFIPIIILISLIFGQSPLFSWLDYGADKQINLKEKNENPFYLLPYVDKNGICDERKFYYSDCGFVPVLFSGNINPQYVWASQGYNSRNSKNKTVVRGAIGFFGYYCGPKIYVIDFHALTDAFLARLDMNKNQFPKWRIGHFERNLPKGYYQTINTNKNSIKDKSLAEYYEKIKCIIRDDIFSGKRLSIIIDFLFNKYDYLIIKNYETESYDDFPYSSDNRSLASFYNNKAIIYDKIKDDYECIKNYKLAIQSDSTFELPIKNFINYYIGRQQYDSAFSMVEKLPSNIQLTYKANIFTVKAFNIYKSGNVDTAIEMTLNAISIDSNYAKAYNNLGAYYMIKNDNENAEKMFMKCISKDRNMIDAYKNLFKIYYQNKHEFEKAKQIAKSIYNLKGNNTDKFILQFLKQNRL